MSKFDITQGWSRGQGSAAADPTRGADLQMMTPARAAGFVSDWVVPALQALTTGALVAGLVVFLLSELVPSWDVNGWKVWAGFGLAISAGVWVALLTDTRKLLRQIETLTGLDLNQDGAIGKPQERLVIVNAGQEKDESAKRATSERASDFARFIAGIPARGCELRAWEGDLSRPVYQEYRDALIRLGWARWKSVKPDGTPNERQGWELTKPAPAILERISG